MPSDKTQQGKRSVEVSRDASWHGVGAADRVVPGRASRSRFGADDQIGMLNVLQQTGDEARRTLFQRATGKLYDLGVEYALGMPTWSAFHDPSYAIWMTHTPTGTCVDDVNAVGRVRNEQVSYSGDSIAMYSHTGTHLDLLNHFGYHHEIWNGFTEKDFLGSRHWTRCGAEQVPPVCARALMLDIPRLVGTQALPPGFGIDGACINNALQAQGLAILAGDVVLIRTGQMQYWNDPQTFGANEPGLTVTGAETLARAGAAIIGADNMALEVQSGEASEAMMPVHSYLLATAGIMILEMAYLEELAADGVYEFLFLAMPLKLRGATGTPTRPVGVSLEAA